MVADYSFRHFNRPEDTEIESKASESQAGNVRRSLKFDIYELWSKVHIDNYNARSNGKEAVKNLKTVIESYPSSVSDFSFASFEYKLKGGEVHLRVSFKGIEDKLDFVPLVGVSLPRRVYDEIEDADYKAQEVKRKADQLFLKNDTTSATKKPKSQLKSKPISPPVENTYQGINPDQKARIEATIAQIESNSQTPVVSNEDRLKIQKEIAETRKRIEKGLSN